MEKNGWIGLGTVALALGVAIAAWRCRDPLVVVVPDDAATVGQAISMVADGGEVIVSEGTWTEHLDVAKAVTIAGVGDVTIAAPDASAPTLTVSGVVALSHVRLAGGSAAVAGRGGVLQASDVTIGSTQRGIEGEFAELRLVDVTIDPVPGAAIDADVGIATLGRVDVIGPAGDAIALGGEGCVVAMDDVFVLGAGGRGIALDGCTSALHGGGVAWARTAGIEIDGGTATIEGAHVERGTPDGLGSALLGIHVVDAEVMLAHVLVEDTATGLRIDGCDSRVTVTDSSLRCADLDIAVWVDDERTWCDCPDMLASIGETTCGCGAVAACEAEGEIACTAPPPDPPEPP